MNHVRAVVGLGMALVLMLGLAYFARDWLQPVAELAAPLDLQCNLGAASCRSAVAGGAVGLSITPRPIAPMKPLAIDVAIEGLSARRVEVDFSGVDMNMGYNRFVLGETAPGHFTGTAVLPVCVRDRMTWEAKVLVDTPDAILSVPFRFETRRGA